MGLAQAGEIPPFPPGNPHGFELHLPEGWTAVDSNLLAWLRASRGEAATGLPAAEGLYAYRRMDATNRFDPPYLIVAVKGGGKMSERSWRKMAEPGEAFRQINAGLRRLPAANGRLLNAAFDTNRFAIRVEMEIRSEFGPLHALGTSFLTEDGFIEIAGINWPSPQPAWTQTVEEVVASVRLADWLRYRKREPVNLSHGRWDWLSLAGFIAVVVAGGLLFIRYQRNNSSADY
jgi:hypothetical protein